VCSQILNCPKNDLKQHYVGLFQHLVQCFPKSAPRTTSGPPYCLRWSANLNTNQYFVLRGALKYFWWSAHRKSLGTTDLVCRKLRKVENHCPRPSLWTLCSCSRTSLTPKSGSFDGKYKCELFQYVSGSATYLCNSKKFNF
jgi:hypothetical protein